MFISEKTVGKHVQNIFEKVRVSNRMELCQKLNATGFIRVDDKAENEKYGENRMEILRFK